MATMANLISSAIGSNVSRRSLRRILRFATVGMLGTLIDVSLFTALNVGFGVPVLVANTISYGAGTVNNFLLHRSWTYGDRPCRSAGAQFLQFAAISLNGVRS